MAGFTSYSNEARADVQAQAVALGVDGVMIWENTGQKPPRQGGGAFARVVVDTSGNRQLTPNWTEHFGAVVVECYDDTENGPEGVEAFAEALAATLRRRSPANFFTYTDAQYQRVGINEELGRFQGNLRVEWTRFENI